MSQWVEMSEHKKMTVCVLTGSQLGDPGVLRSPGLQRIEIRLLRASRAGHDRLVGEVGQWKKAVASLRMAADIPALEVGLQTPLTEGVVKDAELFARLLARITISRPLPVKHGTPIQTW